MQLKRIDIFKCRIGHKFYLKAYIARNSTAIFLELDPLFHCLVLKESITTIMSFAVIVKIRICYECVMHLNK